MGNTLHAFFHNLSKIFENKKGQLLMVGLDAAGKTTVLNKLSHNVTADTIPTIGFNNEKFQYKNIEFVCTDIGGQDRLRSLWHHYYNNTDALIFVVDSSDTGRFGEASRELHKVLSDDRLKSVPVLIFANKQDLQNSKPAKVLAEKLNLQKLKQEHWYVQPCVAVTGEGLYEGLNWLAMRL